MNIKTAKSLVKEDGKTTSLSRSYEIAQAFGYIEAIEKAQALENVLRKIVNYPKGREIVAHFWDSIDNGKLALEEWERVK